MNTRISQLAAAAETDESLETAARRGALAVDCAQSTWTRICLAFSYFLSIALNEYVVVSCNVTSSFRFWVRHTIL